MERSGWDRSWTEVVAVQVGDGPGGRRFGGTGWCGPGGGCARSVYGRSGLGRSGMGAKTSRCFSFPDPCFFQTSSIFLKIFRGLVLVVWVFCFSKIGAKHTFGGLWEEGGPGEGGRVEGVQRRESRAGGSGRGVEGRWWSRGGGGRGSRPKKEWPV